MLRNLGIRSKLLAVLAVPMLVLVIGAAVVSLQAVNAAKDARQVRAISDGARSFSALVSALQAERRVSQAKLSGDYTLGGQLKSIRKQTDATAKATDQLTAGIGLAKLSNEAAKALASNLQARAKLGAVRRQVDKGTISPAAVGTVYSAAIAEEIEIPARISASLSDRALASQLRSYSELQMAAELATQERDLGRQVLNDPSAVAAYTTAVARENDAVQSYWYDASIADRSRMSRAMDTGTMNKQFAAARASLLAVANGKNPTIEDQSWVFLANHHLTALQGLATQVASNAASSAADSATAATNRSWQILGLALLVLLLPILLALVVARAITRPLRGLTEAAGQVRDELPRLVESMATPGETPDGDLVRIPVASQDEVGQLAAAFNDVNQTTMKIAREQAALRGSIAEMFVNVARRNHVLLSRQLSFIDQLERTEEDPDTLDNLFKLDHLATRMRRNAESLIVLAGIDSGRRVRQPMPLSDVIRTAISEIEKYERVDMALRADPPVVGHVALTTAHMLAELLENATQFSNPDTRVFVVTSYSRRGVRVKITDAGLGMTYDEITDANQRIANPPATDVVGASRLGFFVVGRLARRLDARVTLRAARDRGTVVVIDLPAALFVPGTVAEVTGIDDDDEALAENDPQSVADSGNSVSRALPARGNANPHAPRVPTSSEPPAPVAAKTATPFPYDFGTPPEGGSAGLPAAAGPGGLPQRARGGLPQRGADGGLTDAPQRGTATALPRRARTEAAAASLAGAAPLPSEPVAMPTALAMPTAPAEEAVEEARPAKRPGLFSGFRSRTASPAPELVPASSTELAETPDGPSVETSDNVEAVETVSETKPSDVTTEALLDPAVQGPDVAATEPEDAPAPAGEVTVEIDAAQHVAETAATVVIETAEPADTLVDTVVDGTPVVESVEPVESVKTVESSDSEVEPASLSPLAAHLAASLALAAAETDEAEPAESAESAEVESADPASAEVEPPVVEVEVHEPVVQLAVEAEISATEPVTEVEPLAEPVGQFFNPASLLADDDVALTLIEGVETANDIAPLAVPEPAVDTVDPVDTVDTVDTVDAIEGATGTEETGPEEPDVAASAQPHSFPLQRRRGRFEPEPVAEVEPVAEPVAELEPVAEVEPTAEPVAEPLAEVETLAEAPSSEGHHRGVAQRASMFAHFPTRRSKGRHYKAKEEPAPETVAPTADPEPIASEPVVEVAAEVVEPEPVAEVAEVVQPEPAVEVAVAVEPEPEPVAVAVEPEPEPVAEVALKATPASEPEPVSPPAPAPTAAVLDILPGGVTPKSRRLPRPWSRAVKPTAPPPVQRSTPPAYTQAPVPPPVVPTPVTEPISRSVAPVPVVRAVEPEPPAPQFAPTPGVPQIPDSSHFGGQPGAPSAPASQLTGGPSAGLFASLPRREPASSAPVSEPAPPSESPAEYEQRMLRERSAIASEALSELSRLSGYQPAAVESRNSESLARRTPQSTPGVSTTPTSTAEVPHRERNATDVRSMLSGFRAGVERGRADQGRGSEG